MAQIAIPIPAFLFDCIEHWSDERVGKLMKAYTSYVSEGIRTDFDESVIASLYDCLTLFYDSGAWKRNSQSTRT
jgi:hypothetical protein